MVWLPYDPSWLVSLAEDQYPDEQWIADALRRCTRHLVKSPAMIYFVSPDRPNKPWSAWQFVVNIDLYSPNEGTIWLDVLTSQRIGGAEFEGRLNEAQSQ